MINIHYRFLMSRRLETIMVGLVAIMGLFFVAVSEYKQPVSELLYLEEQYRQEYLLLCTTVVKMVILLVMVCLWIYGTRLNRYDVYLLLRATDQTVLGSKYIVLGIVSLCFGVVVSTLMWMVFLLYPYHVSGDVIWGWFWSVSVFILYYTTLFMIVERLYEPVFGFFVPAIGWFVGMMTMDVFTLPETNDTSINYSQLLVPDIVYDNNTYTLMFGPFIVLAIGFLWVVVVFHIIKRRGVFELP